MDADQHRTTPADDGADSGTPDYDIVDDGGVIPSRYRINPHQRDLGDILLGERLTILELLAPELRAPFSAHEIDLKPGAVSSTSDSALALLYADSRTYMDRLDEVLGAGNWHATYKPFPIDAPFGMVCTLYVYEIEVAQATADLQKGDGDNIVTSAEAQCFKRACAAIGVGRYLWQLPQIWGDYDKQRRRFTHPQAVILEAYRKGGVID